MTRTVVSGAEPAESGLALLPEPVLCLPLVLGLSLGQGRVDEPAEADLLACAFTVAFEELSTGLVDASVLVDGDGLPCDPPMGIVVSLGVGVGLTLGDVDGDTLGLELVGGDDFGGGLKAGVDGLHCVPLDELDGLGEFSGEAPPLTLDPPVGAVLPPPVPE